VVFGIKDALLLREENAVLEIGVMKNSGPPIPLQALFRDRVIGGTTSERSPAAGRRTMPRRMSSGAGGGPLLAAATGA